MKPTVVILLSDKRSGSTMFEDELCQHPSVNHVAYTPHSYFETQYWLTAACVLDTPRNLFYHNKRHKGYGSRSGARRFLIDCIRGNAPDFDVPDDDESLVFNGWEAICGKFAQPVFFEKSPQHSHHWGALDLMLKWTMWTEYDVRFISLVRNPMSVMYSAEELFTTNPSERQYGWACAYRNVLKFKEQVGEDCFHMVRYEDLIAEPQQTFSGVLDFLGLEQCSAVGEKVHSHSICKWSNDRKFTLQLDGSVVAVANQFGYSGEDLYNPPKPGLSASEKFQRRISAGFLRTKGYFINRLVKPLLLSTTRRK